MESRQRSRGVGFMGGLHSRPTIISVSPSILKNNVFTAVRTFLTDLFGCEVVQGQLNNVPMPQGDFVLMSALNKTRLSTNCRQINVDSVETTMPTELCMQLDFFGETADEVCQTVVMLIEDGYAVDAFPEDIQPLFCSPPTQIPLVSGEKNYVQRWTTELHLQLNNTVTTATDTFDEESFMRSKGNVTVKPIETL